MPHSPSCYFINTYFQCLHCCSSSKSISSMSLTTASSASIKCLVGAHQLRLIRVWEIVLVLAAQERQCRREEAVIPAAMLLGVAYSLVRIEITSKALAWSS